MPYLSEEEWVLAQAIYDRLEPELLRDHRYEFIQIEPTTGEYVITGTLLDSLREFRTKFPEKPGWVTRIGAPLRI